MHYPRRTGWRIVSGSVKTAAGDFAMVGFFKEKKGDICARVSWEVLIGMLVRVAK